MPPPYPTPDSPDLPEAVRIACILVNWNGAAYTIACLEALALQTCRDLVIVVVDNGSTDNSVEQLSAWIARHARDPAAIPVYLLPTGANLGFAGGNNAGIAWAARHRPAYLWLLNNDTVAPPATLAHLVAEADSQLRAGLVGTVLRYAHNPARVQAWGGGHIDPQTAYATHFTMPHIFGRDDYLTFASVLLRAAMLQQTGLLDDRFFMYFEDAEFCLRAQRAGWGMTVAADTAVLHHEGGSDAAGRPSLQKERTTTASALLLIRLYARRPRLGAALFLARRLGKRLLTGQWSAAKVILQQGLQPEKKKPSPN